MTNPFFSIVVPSRNRAHTIARALDSCRRQTDDDFEVVVVDDEGSTDNMGAALSARPYAFDVRLIERYRGRAAAARNAGVQEARGEFVAFLDADDEFLPDKLERCRRVLVERPDDVVYSRNVVDRGVGRYWLKPARGLREGEDIFEYVFVHGGWFHPTSVVVKRRTALALPFREDLGFGDDVQFAVDLWRAGHAFTMLDTPSTIYHDTYFPGRLSQTPAFERTMTEDHAAFERWAESHRDDMPPAAWLSYRATCHSRFIVTRAPLRALGEIWRATFAGSAGIATSIAQTVQTFAPGIYRRLCDLVVRVAGLKGPIA